MAAPAMAPMSGSEPGRRVGERGEIGQRRMAGGERPPHQPDQHRHLEPVEDGHDAAAEAGSEIVERAEDEQKERRKGGCQLRGHGDERLQIRNRTDTEGRGHAGIHDDGSHPSIKKRDPAPEAAAEVEIFAAVLRVAHRQFGEAQALRPAS